MTRPIFTETREAHHPAGDQVPARRADAADRVEPSGAEKVRLRSTEAADVAARTAVGVKLAVVAALITGAWVAAL